MTIVRVSGSGRVKAIAEAVRTIEGGGIVAFPTETFYGLGVRYDNVSALKKLYELKRRSGNKALPLIIGDRKVLDLIAVSMGEIEKRIAEGFWPGPLTLLVAAKEGLHEFITAGTGKVAVRIPGSSFALDLVKSLEFPITATSANISGKAPADRPDEVVEYFGDNLDMLVDCGITPGGKPSTIVEVSGREIRILRTGVITKAEILKKLAG